MKIAGITAAILLMAGSNCFADMASQEIFAALPDAAINSSTPNVKSIGGLTCVAEADVTCNLNFNFDAKAIYQALQVKSGLQGQGLRYGGSMRLTNVKRVGPLSCSETLGTRHVFTADAANSYECSLSNE
jgi:hypothetical protein